MTAEQKNPQVETEKPYLQKLSEYLVTVGNFSGKISLISIGFLIMYTTNASEIKHLLIEIAREKLNRKSR